jgi:hypothetical protein
MCVDDSSKLKIKSKGAKLHAAFVTKPSQTIATHATVNTDCLLERLIKKRRTAVPDPLLTDAPTQVDDAAVNDILASAEALDDEVVFHADAFKLYFAGQITASSIDLPNRKGQFWLGSVVGSCGRSFNLYTSQLPGKMPSAFNVRAVPNGPTEDPV